jgi:3-oxoacyl-[acyl-carrier protein] reductase
VELSEKDWNSLLAVHLTGTFLCCRAAVDPLLASGGRIVNLSSSYGFKGRPNGAHYSAAKAGVVALTKVLALELAPRANANAIAPGPIDTPRWRTGLSDADYAAKKAARVAEIPLGRMGAPEDIAATALFLLGPASTWITGQVLHVNGGEFLP